MCIICKDLDNLTPEEAMRNIGELLISTTDKEQIKHLIEVSDKVMDKDQPLVDNDPWDDGNWWNENNS
jgi:hypothetical protein